jgi:hypothetical protein
VAHSAESFFSKVGEVSSMGGYRPCEVHFINTQFFASLFH